MRMNASARRSKPKARLNAYEALLAEDRNVEARPGPDPHPRRPAARRHRRRGRRPAQGLRRPAADRRPLLQAAARRDRRRDRPQRRRQDDAAADDHRPGAARRRHAEARRHGRAGLRRPVTRRAGPRTSPCGRRSPAAPTRSRSGSGRSTAAPTWPASTSRAPTSRRRWPSSPAASATACTWPSCCAPAATCCCSTSRPTTWTPTPCGRWRRRCCRSPAARSSSHDRWFLDRIATHVLAFEGDSQVRWFEGNFEAYESFRHEQLGAEADRPTPDHLQEPPLLIALLSPSQMLAARGWNVYATARRPEKPPERRVLTALASQARGRSQDNRDGEAPPSTTRYTTGPWRPEARQFRPLRAIRQGGRVRTGGDSARGQVRSRRRQRSRRGS